MSPRAGAITAIVTIGVASSLVLASGSACTAAPGAFGRRCEDASTCEGLACIEHTCRPPRQAGERGDTCADPLVDVLPHDDDAGLNAPADAIAVGSVIFGDSGNDIAPRCGDDGPDVMMHFTVADDVSARVIVDGPPGSSVSLVPADRCVPVDEDACIQPGERGDVALLSAGEWMLIVDGGASPTRATAAVRVQIERVACPAGYLLLDDVCIGARSEPPLPEPFVEAAFADSDGAHITLTARTNQAAWTTLVRRENRRWEFLPQTDDTPPHAIATQRDGDVVVLSEVQFGTVVVVEPDLLVDRRDPVVRMSNTADFITLDEVHASIGVNDDEVFVVGSSGARGSLRVYRIEHDSGPARVHATFVAGSDELDVAGMTAARAGGVVLLHGGAQPFATLHLSTDEDLRYLDAVSDRAGEAPALRRGYASIATTRNGLFVVAGGSLQGDTAPIDDVELFDPRAATVTRMPFALPRPERSPAIAALGERALVVVSERRGVPVLFVQPLSGGPAAVLPLQRRPLAIARDGDDVLVAAAPGDGESASALYAVEAIPPHTAARAPASCDGGLLLTTEREYVLTTADGIDLQRSCPLAAAGYRRDVTASFDLDEESDVRVHAEGRTDGVPVNIGLWDDPCTSALVACAIDGTSSVDGAAPLVVRRLAAGRHQLTFSAFTGILEAEDEAFAGVPILVSLQVSPASSCDAIDEERPSVPRSVGVARVSEGLLCDAGDIDEVAFVRVDGDVLATHIPPDVDVHVLPLSFAADEAGGLRAVVDEDKPHALAAWPELPEGPYVARLETTGDAGGARYQFLQYLLGCAPDDGDLETGAPEAYARTARQDVGVWSGTLCTPSDVDVVRVVGRSNGTGLVVTGIGDSAELELRAEAGPQAGSPLDVVWTTTARGLEANVPAGVDFTIALGVGVTTGAWSVTATGVDAFIGRGDTCDDAIALVGAQGELALSTTATADDVDFASCTRFSNPGADRFFRIDIPAQATLSLRMTSEEPLDGNLQILDACPTTENDHCIVGIDDFGPGESLAWTNESTSVRSVVVLVDSFYATPYSYLLRWEVTP